MNGNISQQAQIVNDTTVSAKGWVAFEAGDPNVQVWVGVGQGERGQPGAIYGEGSVTVDNPNPAAIGTQKVWWEADAEIENGAGKYQPGAANGAAVAIGAGDPYPWGRQVNLKPPQP
jgi:hypothetical protein